ncbi:MAG TPA: YMGG-like glycine zipper-containing protein [Chitinophagaceae bacterium]
MKKLVPFLSIAILAAACNTGSKEEAMALSAEQQLQAYKDSIKRTADTAGLAEFQQWRAQNELAAQPVQEEPAAQYAPPAPRPKAAASRSVAKAPSRAKAPVASRPSTRSESPAPSVGNGSDVATGAGAGEEATAQKKEGWSKAAKGAVIGGAGGAVAGAVINKKNRAVGAVVGGILGAGGGYVIGRQADKKDGRIEYTEYAQ